MIIETMEQLGKCIDDGVELEMYFPDPSAHWGKINRTLNWGVVPEAVEEGRIRTKPRTVKLTIRTIDGDDSCSSIWFGHRENNELNGFTDHHVTVTLEK